MAGCHHEPKPVQSTNHIGMMDDTVVNYNRQLVTKEMQEIEDFIRRYRWQMNTTPTGLRFMIYKQGSGALAKTGEMVSINYSVRLISGDLVYQSDPLNPFSFETGRARVPNGLEEGVMLLKPGSRAKLIVPAHLAFGLLGDLDRIPQRATLVYDVERCITRPLKK
jgi:FKBP-type peptidyl-prolyl cis-trans isomerase FkpA